MKTTRRILGFALLITMGTSLSGCAVKEPAVSKAADDRITADIRSLFAKTGYLQGGYNIQVETSDGVVQLYGLVDTELELAEVESIAHGVPGVTEVRDDISVSNFKD